jgi:hypothetical protein
MKKLAIVALLILAGCGGRATLKPQAGQSMPPKPAMARETPSVDALLTPRPEQRPDRVEELLKRSEERPDDRFDLPPPG